MEDTLEQLQRMLDILYRDRAFATRLDVLVRAEAMDLPDDILAILALIPPGRYRRQRLCDQLNSAITAHGLGRTLGTVE